MSNTIPVRSGEEIDELAIKNFILKHTKDIPDTSLEIRQFTSGKSNLTYVIKIGDWEAVLRRPPFGPLPTKAHDMKREYELLKNLHTVFPLVPETHFFCGDEKVIGCPFYVMELKKGEVINEDLIKKKNLDEQGKRYISHLMVDAIVNLHNVDYKKAGLEKIGYPDGFLKRQLNNWIKRYNKYKTEEISNIENLINWLENNLPPNQEPALIHNDFKLNNVLLSEDSKEINAILDWEMATIGDPLFDLGATLSYWIEENDSQLLKESLDTTTAQPGFISRKEFLESYAKKTNRDVSSFPFYLILSYFKIAVAQQQIYYRYLTGQTQDKRFLKYKSSVKNLITYANGLTQNKEIL